MTDTTLVFDLALRAAVVLAFAWLLAIVMRRASAAARHLVWTCAIAAAALAPPAALLTPGWQVTSPVAAVVTPPPPSLAAVSVPDSVDANGEVRPTRARSSHSASGAAVTPPDYAAMSLMAWAVGTLGVLLYVAAGLLGCRRLRHSAQPDAASIAETQALAEALDIARPVAVLQSAAVTTPMVCGFWRPAIILPPGAASWPAARRHVVMLHELAHVKRRDCLTQRLAQVVCALYWFNPLVWIAARQLRIERERACDDFVLAAGARSSDYASHLLEIAQAMQPARLSPLAATAVAMARRTQLEGRLMAILDPAVRRSSAFRTRFAVFAIVALVSVPVAGVHLVAPTPPRADMRAPAVADGARITAAQNAAAAVPANAAQAAEPRQPPTTAAGDRVRRALNRSLVEFASNGDLEGIDAMLTTGAEVNAEVPGDGTPLIAAAGDDQIDAVRLLLDRGADPNLRVSGDGSALTAAAGDGHVEIVGLLLDRGADPNLVTPDDGSALTSAAREGHLEIVRLLLDRGANPNLITPSDGTALTEAAREGHTAVVDLLLQRGALVDLIAEGDETALIQASGEGHLDLVRLLVSRGADVNLGVWANEVIVEVTRSDAGSRGAWRQQMELRTPLNQARDEGHTAVEQFLISAGARD